MNKPGFTKIHAALAAAAVGLALSGTAAASVVSVDFESLVGYTLAADAGGLSTRSTEQSLSPTHSAKFELPNNTTPNNDFAKVIVDVLPGALDLGKVTGSFWTFVPGGQASGASYAPYMYFAVDTDGSGAFSFGLDSFVIAFFTPAVTVDNWMQVGLDQTSQVHVVGARPGLLSTQFSSSNGGGVLADLAATSTGSGLWGDLDILQVRVGAGDTGSNIAPFVAFVDDINVSAVPVPATLGLFLLGLAGLRVSRRKQA